MNSARRGGLSTEPPGAAQPLTNGERTMTQNSPHAPEPQPRVRERDEQAYAGIPVTVTMQTFPQAADATFPEVFGWLAERGIAPAGPPFIRYHVIDMDAELEVEFGVPVDKPVQADGRVRPGVLPAGRYVSLLHVGPYDGLVAANGAVQDWARRQGITLESSADEKLWQGRVEYYLSDPREVADPAQWQTEVDYLISDGPA
jgi:effector-binding domain-containing protein